MRRFRPVLMATCLALLAASGFAQTTPGEAFPEFRSFLAVSAPDAFGLRPTQISWSPLGRLSYFWDEGGDTLWWMDPDRGVPEVLFRTADLARLDESDDFEVDEYVWAPKDHAVALVAGGDLFLFELEGRALRRLTRTPDAESDPKLSPDGTRLAFVRDYDLFVLDLATGRERALTTDGTADTFLNGATDWVYWEEIWERDSTGFWWSPDGGKIAYYRFDERPVGTYPIADLAKLDPTVHDQKYPRPGEANPVVRVGVLDLGSGRTTWMRTGEEDSYLTRVSWSPAGEVDIQKLSRDQTKLELLRCAAADGRCAPLVSETWPTWINLGPGYHPLPDGRFLWGSEETGWRRLYLHDKDGKRLRAVTPEGWNVTSLDAVTPDGWVVFTGFRSGTLGAAERHVLRARLNEDRVEELTRDPGTHAAVVAPDGKSWVHTWSTADTLARAELRRDSGEPVALPFQAPSGYDPAKLPKWELLTIPGPGGLQLPARILKPANFDPARRYPALMYHYGGPGSQVVVNGWDQRGREHFHKLMAQRGFVVAQVDNPASIFFGKPGEDKVHRRFGEENLPAQLAMVDYLKKTGYVDPGRIGLWGWSGGGIHTLYCILNRPGVWKAAMAGAPVTDWRLYDSIWTERYLGTPQNNPEGFRLSSPLFQIENLKDQLLLVHGLADDNVHPQHTVMLTDRLVKAGIPFEVAYYPGQKHTFQGPSRGHFFARMAEFFTRTLMGVEVEDVEVRVGGE